MGDDELVERIRELRAKSVPPKAIARTLGVPVARVTPVVRALAVEAEAAMAAGERPLVGCWVNQGWSEELIVSGHPEWPKDRAEVPGASGLVSLVVVRQAPRGRVELYGYLVDVFCLGVKDLVGPKVMDPHLLDGYLRTYYDGYGRPPIPAPLELAQDVVFGAIEYARSLGFEPTRDFTDAAAAHLGRWTPPSAVTFGREGKPLFIQGPRDDTTRIMRTLRGTVGDGNFDYLLQLGSGPGMFA